MKCCAFQYIIPASKNHKTLSVLYTSPKKPVIPSLAKHLAPKLFFLGRLIGFYGMIKYFCTEY